MIEYNCQCYYYETSIHDIVLLINAGLIKQRQIGYCFREPVLEVDKNDDRFIKHSCVLCCYYCNNDKSYTMQKDAYKDHFAANRQKYFKKLLHELRQTHV